MCRSSSPLFGARVFRRFSGDEFERRCRQPRAFRQEGMDHGVTMSADAEHRLVGDGQDRRRQACPSAAGCARHVSLALRGCRAV